MRRSDSIWVSTIVAACAAPSLTAQCADWHVSPLLEGVRGGNSPVTCSTTWDPDGAGPLGSWLVVTGGFSTFGGVQANRIAAWDGTRWRAFGSGINGPIYTVKVHNGDLYVGGEFSNAGGVAAANIARWTGGVNGAWQAVGNGLYDPSVSGQQWVASLEVYNHELCAAGTFSYATPQGTRRTFAIWNGSSWRTPLGIRDFQLDGHGYVCSVNVLQQYNNELILGGGFALNVVGPPVNVAAFNGTSFRTLGGSVDRSALDPWPIRMMGVHGVDLIVGGEIGRANGVPVSNIAAWNGTAWRALGAGLSRDPSTMTTFQGQLVVGGESLGSNGTPFGPMAAWTGSAWSAYAPGLSSSVKALTPWGSDLFVGGWIFQVPGVSTPNHAAFFTPPSTWTPCEGQARVNAMAMFRGRCIVGGSFASTYGIETPNAFNGSNLFSWNGVSRTAIGEPTATPYLPRGVNGPVNALKAYTRGLDSNLIVAGEFSATDAGPARNIALWTESVQFGQDGWSTLGAGFNAVVNACEYYNNTIYAAGAFTASGDGTTTLNRIAKYDSANRRWTVLAGTDLNGTVNALKVYNNTLYAGGSFTNANGQNCGGLARWNGTSWSTVGGFFGGVVHALDIHNNELVIGGLYTGLPGSPNLAKYNGTSYSAIGTGGTNGTVRSIAAGSDGALYIGGDFTTAGNQPAARVARWANGAWTGVASGVDAPVRAMLAYRNEIETGGDFTFVRGGALRSPGWARFSIDGKPWAAVNPSIIAGRCIGDLVRISVTPAEGIDASFQWRRNGVALANGATGHGSSLSGTRTSILGISSARGADNGTYDCVLTNSCGSTITASVSLNLCAADANCDGFLDFFDYDDFVRAFESGSPAVTADFNGDGFIDFFDYDDFVHAFESGC